MIRKVIYNETENENLVVAESANDESRELLNQLITSRV